MLSSNYRDKDMIWKSIKVNDKVHMICFAKENESWKVLLTDLAEIWTETLTDETMFHKCQTLNPLLNFQALDWKKQIMDMLNNIPENKTTCSLTDTAYRIELVYPIKLQKNFAKLKFVLDLLKGTSQQFWEAVTMPLCLSSMELNQRYEILLDLVKQKDEEIAEYKAGGAELIREHIATKPFSEQLFHTKAAAPADFIKAFQSVLGFYNAMSLPKQEKSESEISLNSAVYDNSYDDTVKTDRNVTSTSSKSKCTQQDKQMCSKVEKKCETGLSTSKTSILKSSSISHMIQKTKKTRKTFSDCI